MAGVIVFVFVVTSLFYFTVAVPEAGIKEMSFNKDLQFHGFHKSLFSGGNIYISGESSNISQTNPLIVKWTLFFSECAQAYAGLQDKKLRDLPQEFFDIHVVDRGMQSISGNGPFYLIESVHKKETVYKFPKSNVSKSKAQKNTSPKNTSSKNTPPKKTSPKNTPPKNTSPKNTPPKKTPPKDTSPKNTSPKDTSPKNTSPKDTSPKNTPPENTPQKNTSPKNTSPKNTPPKTTLQLKRKRENRANGNEKHRTEERSSPSHLNDKRIKRAAENHATLQEDTSAATNPSQSLTKKLKKKLPTTAQSGHVMKGHSQSGRVTTVGKDGNYLLRVKVSRQQAPKSEYKVQITVQIKSDKYGFLSAAEWPLLPFYGVMSLVYLAYGVVWLIVSACQWRELLRIQFWIGGVIALGMLEKAVLFSEYNNVNNTGVPAHGLVVFGLVISCIKRTLSRILIIIVSLGFGIVKPRLGAALHRVLAVGLLYFILCVIEGGYREKALKADVENKQLIAAIPLSILDAVICWWIFMSLMQTMRTLRIRKNIVKLSLYRHFTNILVFSVIASVAFMVWSIKSYHLNACIKDWKELWIDEAFWHFLFAIVLLAIMVLWRPTANNQRYAFTPLIDVGEDDDDDMTLSDAFNGMKMRNKSEGDVANRADKHKSKLEDDLRWVEENIPTAGGIDTALPTLLDSDEEVMTTKLEMSKME